MKAIDLRFDPIVKPKINKLLLIAPIQVKQRVDMIMVFLPNLSARIESRIKPVILPTN